MEGRWSVTQEFLTYAIIRRNPWSCWLFFMSVRWLDSEVKIWTRPLSNRQPKMAKKSRVTTTQLVFRHWCQASRIRGCGMVLNSAGPIRFTMAGCMQNNSSWLWKFRFPRVTFHDCDVAPVTSQMLTRALFSLSVWPSPRLNFDLRRPPSDSTEKNLSASELMILERNFPSNTICCKKKKTGCSEQEKKRNWHKGKRRKECRDKLK